MKLRTITIAVVFSFALMLITGSCYAQKTYCSIGGGFYSKMSQEESESWNPGFNAGSNVFYYVTPNILVGGRFA